MRHLSWTTVLLATLAINSIAQDAPAPAQNPLAPAAPSDSPASREDVLKLFDVMRVHEQMRNVIQAVVSQQRDMAHDVLRKRMPNISDDKLAHFDAMMDESVKEMPVEEIEADMVPIYQKHLSKADVESMSAFYASPTGQKVLNEMPAMTTEAMQAAYERMQKHIQDTMDQVEKMMKENQLPAKPKAKPAPRQPAKPTT